MDNKSLAVVGIFHWFEIETTVVGLGMQKDMTVASLLTTPAGGRSTCDCISTRALLSFPKSGVCLLYKYRCLSQSRKWQYVLWRTVANRTF